jgi:EAL domain-containing protein (putative c-di-GMP-specific phosphodiesterase class I)/CheY-like chemotaxis protein
MADAARQHLDPITVLVADDEDNVRDVLSAVVASDSGLRLVGAVEEAEAAIQLAAAEQPDVALVDVRMPGGGGLRAAREIARHSPPTRVVAISAYEDVDTVLAMLRAGARTYVAKSDSTDEILRAIHRVVEQAEGPSTEVDRVVRAFDDWKDHEVRRPSLVELRRARLEKALQPGVLSARLHPVVDLASAAVVGAEAVPACEGRTSENPDSWFADAQTIGMLPRMELAVVRLAVRLIDGIPDHAWLALRLSPATLESPELMEAIEGVPADRIVVQLTEQAPIVDPDALDQAIGRLRAAGMRLAIDDMGTGIVSLRRLLRMCPDFVKLDSTLTSRIDDDPTRQALVGALASIAADRGATVIAKGIVTASAARALVQLGVGLVQSRVGDVRE